VRAQQICNRGQMDKAEDF